MPDLNEKFDNHLKEKSQQQLESLCRGLMGLLIRKPDEIKEIISQSDLYFHMMLSPDLAEHWKRDIISTIHFLREQFNATGAEDFHLRGEVPPNRDATGG